MDHIIIEGFMGSGKGNIGKKVAAALGIPLIDIDRMIMDRMKSTPAEIYDRFGDVYYRALETYMLSKLLSEKDRSVIIVGSGLPTMPQNKEYLQDLGKVYYLQADAAFIASRLEKNKKRDWLGESEDLRDKVRVLLKEREPGYLSVADVIIPVAKRNSADIVNDILADVKGGAEEPAKEPEESAPAEEIAEAEETAATSEEVKEEAVVTVEEPAAEQVPEPAAEEIKEPAAEEAKEPAAEEGKEPAAEEEKPKKKRKSSPRKKKVKEEVPAEEVKTPAAEEIKEPVMEETKEPAPEEVKEPAAEEEKPKKKRKSSPRKKKVKEEAPAEEVKAPAAEE